MEDIQHDTKKIDAIRLTSEELERLYNMYFTPSDVKTQPLFFEQVSLFDYSLESYTTDSVSPSKISYA